jgi:hypothetical protein
MWRPQSQDARAGVAQQQVMWLSPRARRTWLLCSSGTSGGWRARDSKAWTGTVILVSLTRPLFSRDVPQVPSSLGFFLFHDVCRDQLPMVFLVPSSKFLLDVMLY